MCSANETCYITIRQMRVSFNTRRAFYIVYIVRIYATIVFRGKRHALATALYTCVLLASRPLSPAYILSCIKHKLHLMSRGSLVRGRSVCDGLGTGSLCRRRPFSLQREQSRAHKCVAAARANHTRTHHRTAQPRNDTTRDYVFAHVPRATILARRAYSRVL